LHHLIRRCFLCVCCVAQFQCALLQPLEAAPDNTFENIKGWQQKGWALRTDRRYAEAEAAQKKALELVQKAPQYSTMEGDVYSDIMEALEYQKKYEEAVVFGNKAIQTGKNSPFTNDNINLHIAKSYSALKKYNQAAPLLDQIIKHSQSDAKNENHNSLYGADIAEAQKLLADCYAREKKDGLAEANYKASIALPQTYLPLNSEQRLPALRAYLEFLQAHKRTKDAIKISARIKDIETHPLDLHRCGTSALRARQWLNWQPKNP
jgi:tetratricopeptide (TPR) repeat protein